MATARYGMYRRDYTDEFKAHAVRLTQHSSIMIKDVASALDIHPFMLSRWRKEYREGKIVADKRKGSGIVGMKASDIKEIRKLKDKLRALEIENDLLKKTIQFNLERKKQSSSS